MGNLHLVSARTDDSKLPDLPESVQVGLADLAESALEELMSRRLDGLDLVVTVLRSQGA